MTCEYCGAPDDQGCYRNCDSLRQIEYYDVRYDQVNERVEKLEKEVEALTNICKKLILKNIFGDF